MMGGMGPIIVGVDGSKTATAAARRAAELAAALDAPLVIVVAHAATHGTIPVGAGSDSWIVGEAEVAIATAKEAAKEVGHEDIELVTIELADKPADALCAEAKKRDAQMIVVGNRRVQGLSRLLGSVATQVLRGAPCDVHIAMTS